MTPYEPSRPEEYFSEARQHDLVAEALEASTLLDNVGSQRVLDHNGFTRIGLAPGYLTIDGRRQHTAG